MSLLAAFSTACSSPLVVAIHDDAGGASTGTTSAGSSSTDSSSTSNTSNDAGTTLSDASTGGTMDGAPNDAAASGDGCIANLQCMPTAPSTGDFNADCVARVNQFSACVCLPPLARWDAGESCANQDSQYDFTQNTAHAGFTGKVCTPQGNAENECPAWPSTTQIVSEPYSAHGHFINMTNTSYKMVACGFYKSDGGFWSVQNFQ